MQTTKSPGDVISIPRLGTQRMDRSMQDQFTKLPTRIEYRPSSRRRAIPSGVRSHVLSEYGGICAYCEYEANQVDHIVPWAFGGSNDIDNLVASCGICNCIANDRVFDSFDAKRRYIRGRYGPYLEKRLHRAMMRLSVCGDCRSIYQPNVDGSSAVLCGSCYAIN